MQDSLVGYLLGALDDDEAARIEVQLKNDPQLQAQLELAAKSLQPLMLDDAEINPSSGLVAKTCWFVSQAVAVPAAAELPARVSVMSTDRGVSSSTWRMVDVAVAASVLLGASLMCLPAINNARYHAQMAGCRNNLRQIGLALFEFSENAQGYFPAVPSDGNLAVAGMYAPTLKDFGLVLEDGIFLCPAAPDIETMQAFRVPSIEQILRAKRQALAVMQRGMGGHFGYTLGYREHGKLQGVRNRGREHFALMSDAPGDRMSCSVPWQRRHCQVLFESGRVGGLSPRVACWRGDELFVNDDGEVSAGVHAGDAVIGSSATPPIGKLHFAGIMSDR